MSTSQPRRKVPSVIRIELIDGSILRLKVNTTISIEHLRDLKLKERADGSAELQGHTAYTKCTALRARSESEARERKASAIASTLGGGGLSAHDVQTWTQPQRDAVAQRAGQRPPSAKTWAVVLSKLQMRRAA